MARSDWVVKANTLINARYDWTMLQQRMVLMMIAQLDMHDEDFGIQRVDVADLVDRSGLSGKAYYERAAEAAHVLLDQKIYVRVEDGRWRGYNLLSYVEAHPGHVLARFNPDMRPFLLQLKRRFTRYMLDNVMRFQSPYSVRIYEMAMQFADLGHRTIRLDDLREVLGVDEKYPRFYDFKRRVLDQATKEIGRYTDIVVTYDITRKGRKPTHVKLYVRPKTDTELASRKRVKKAPDPHQVKLDLPTRPADTKEAPEAAAFRAWWRQRTPDEQAAMEAKAAKRLDPFIRQLLEADASSLSAQGALRDELLGIWR
ncbi:MAG: replication initiation protein, partial [Bacteroidota bacterium]